MTGTITMPPPMPIRPASNPAPAPEINPRQTNQSRLIGTPKRVGYNSRFIASPRGATARIADGSEKHPRRDVEPVDAGDPGKLPGRRIRRSAYGPNAKSCFTHSARTRAICCGVVCKPCAGVVARSVIISLERSVTPGRGTLSEALLRFAGPVQATITMLDGKAVAVLRSVFKDLKNWAIPHDFCRIRWILDQLASDVSGSISACASCG